MGLAEHLDTARRLARLSMLARMEITPSGRMYACCRASHKVGSAFFIPLQGCHQACIDS